MLNEIDFVNCTNSKAFAGFSAGTLCYLGYKKGMHRFHHNPAGFYARVVIERSWWRKLLRWPPRIRQIKMCNEADLSLLPLNWTTE